MYKCYNCNNEFIEPTTVYETHGLDCPPYEEFGCCPHCRSDDFEKLECCEVCGGHFEELHGGVCAECIANNSDFETCYKVGERCKEEYQLNGLLQYFFTDDEIENILLRELERVLGGGNFTDRLREFVGSDPESFGEILKEVI